ncbi:MAG: hypothetical protein AAF327_23460, partial [Cyanobacteria bacterium P01_A01_bin.37]
HLWDFAGVDGLQVAIALFSPDITYIAPFQSLTTEFNQQPCAVLRLCEGNFRVALPAGGNAIERAIADLGLKVWVKPCDRIATLFLFTDKGLERLSQLAMTKPIYTLSPFPLNRAVPARINGIAILAWHILWQGQPKLVIQTAVQDCDTVHAAFLQSVTAQ